MIWDVRFADSPRVGARGMKKGAAGAARTIDGFFVEKEEVVGVVVVLLADHVHQAGPAVADANDLISFAQGAESDGADRGIEAGNVAAPGENADDPFLGLDVCHVWIVRLFVKCGTENYPLCREF